MHQDTAALLMQKMDRLRADFLTLRGEWLTSKTFSPPPPDLSLDHGPASGIALPMSLTTAPTIQMEYWTRIIRLEERRAVEVPALQMEQVQQNFKIGRLEERVTVQELKARTVNKTKTRRTAWLKNILIFLPPAGTLVLTGSWREAFEALRHALMH